MSSLPKPEFGPDGSITNLDELERTIKRGALEERNERRRMEAMRRHHPDYTDRELRMCIHLGTLIEFACDQLRYQADRGTTYPLMGPFIKRLLNDYGPWPE